MLFVVQFEDVYAEQPHCLPERAQHMADHLAFLAGHGDRVIAAGALRPSADGTSTGGTWIITAESHATVETFWKAGLRKSVRVSHWAKAYWSPAFTDCVRALSSPHRVSDLVGLSRDVMAAFLVQLERQGGHPGSEGGLPMSGCLGTPPAVGPCTTASSVSAPATTNTFLPSDADCSTFAAP